MATPLQESHKDNRNINQQNNYNNGIKSSLKRSKSFGLHQRSGVSFAPNKKLCLSPMLSRRNSATIATLYNNNDSSSSESSDEDQDDSQDESCYINNQRRAKKRAFSFKRSASFTDDKLNHAVSKYSDVDEAEDDATTTNTNTNANSPNTTTTTSKCNTERRISQPSSPLPQLTSISCGSIIPSDVADIIEPIVSTTNLTRNHRDSFTSQNLSGDSKNQIRRSSIDCDQVARSRCFDYLVTAIDEAWARYCDATAYAEDEVYNNNGSAKMSCTNNRPQCYIPNTPASLGLSEEEDEEDEEEDVEIRKNSLYDDVDDGYKSASTNITEYDSDFEPKRKISSQPSSVKLQQLKDRLLKAKYYLQDFIESTQFDEACAFWKRWDLIKYATIELVEDDDDDEIIESTIEDLEKGRFYGYS